MKWILLCLLMASAAYGKEISFSNYLKMQEALAKDNYEGALASHKEICSKEINAKKDSYKDCGKKFKNIDELRASFKSLSDFYMEHGDKKELQKLMKASCPMYPGKWVQKSGSIANPYYGKSMLECGEKI